MTDNKIDPQLLAELRKQLTGDIKAQLVEELKDEKVKQQELLLARREEERKARETYVTLMKDSSEPWVEFVGDMPETDRGVRTQLDWNDAWVAKLRSEGITGIDDEQVVQRWLALLLRDIADDMESQSQGPSKTEFA